MKPRILILTAGFGDGHNSAARHLAEALAENCEVLVADPCAEGNPRINRILCRLYREVTTYLPKLWSLIYRSTDEHDFSKPLPLIAKTEEAVGRLLEDFAPDLVVNTYPLYPYIIDRKSTTDLPVVTVITDSIEVNAAWSRSPTDLFLVTDDHTAEVLKTDGIPPDQIKTTGFPVSSEFDQLQPLSGNVSCDPFRVLFFPTARSPHVVDIVRAVLSENTHVTIVLGRNVRRLYRKVKALQKEHPDRITIKGWSKKVPELLTSHHLVIGKAGGATVHEALAAQCPMLVHHIVPGQEEGNIELLSRYQVGSLATSASAIRHALRKLLQDDAHSWREQKKRLVGLSKSSASQAAADHLLKLLDPS